MLLRAMRLGGLSGGACGLGDRQLGRIEPGRTTRLSLMLELGTPNSVECATGENDWILVSLTSLTLKGGPCKQAVEGEGRDPDLEVSGAGPGRHLPPPPPEKRASLSPRTHSASRAQRPARQPLPSREGNWGPRRVSLDRPPDTHNHTTEPPWIEKAPPGLPRTTGCAELCSSYPHFIEAETEAHEIERLSRSHTASEG